MPRTDAAIVKPRVAQHPVRERKALAEDKGGEGELFALEKLMQVRRCHPLRDCGNGQVAVAAGFYRSTFVPSLSAALTHSQDAKERQAFCRPA